MSMSWPNVPLSKCCDIVSGSTPRREVAAYWNGHIPWVTPKDISELNGKKILEDAPEYITDVGYKACSTRMLPQGSILFSSRAPIGLVAVAGRDMCTNQGFKSLVPHKNVDSNYLYHCMRWMAPKIAKLGNGATFKEVSKSTMDRIEIPLPPLEDQKSIATILDKADAIRRKRAESLKLLDDLLRATFLDMFGDPITNPKGWPTKQLADVVAQGTIVTYGIVQAGPEYPGGVPYIRTGDIKNGAILQDRLLHTSPEIASKFKRSEVKAGDLVMSIRATVGTLAMVPSSLAGSNLTQGTAKISPGPEVDGKFLFSYITSEGCQNWIQRQVKGATFREITLSKLREMPIAVPNKNIQYQFRAICDQIETIKMQYVTHTTESETLFHSLVARAFKGEL